MWVGGVGDEDELRVGVVAQQADAFLGGFHVETFQVWIALVVGIIEGNRPYLLSIIDFIVLIVMLFVGVDAVVDASEEMNKPKVETVVDNNGNNEWEYDSKDDEMTNSKSYFATILSDNGEVFAFPYDEEGGSHLMVTVRQTKKSGTDVILGISKGQFNTDIINGQYVSVKFDNNAAKKYKTSSADDGSLDVLFIDNAKDFIAKAKTAKTIKIEAEFYQEGNQVFTFTADKPLKWEH